MKSIEIQRQVNDEALQLLLHRKNLLLVVPGSLLCLRGVYMKALYGNQVHHLRFVPLSNEDYILGTAEDKICEAVCQGAKKKGVEIIVIYVSCLDILTRIHFENIERQLSKETGCVVRCFFRGPLSKQECAKSKNIQNILLEVPEGQGEIEETEEIPPPLSDVAGISDWLRDRREAHVLLTPSGCQNCLRYGDMMTDQDYVYYTEMKEGDLVFGLEDTVNRQMEELDKKGEYERKAVITSAIPSFVGVHGDFIGEKGRDILFPSDGFHDAVSGVSMAQMMVVKKAASTYKGMGKYVEILGYSPLLCGGKSAYKPFISFFKSLGYDLFFSGERREPRARPGMVWAVSSAGVETGLWMNNMLGVPLLIGSPMGSEVFSYCKQQISRLFLEQGAIGWLYGHEQEGGAGTRKVLVIGDPVHTRGISHYLTEEFGVQCTCAAYAWTRKTEKIYQLLGGTRKVHVFRSKEELLPLWNQADIVIGDLLLGRSMPTKTIISNPWGFISGRKGGSGQIEELVRKISELLRM